MQWQPSSSGLKSTSRSVSCQRARTAQVPILAVMSEIQPVLVVVLMRESNPIGEAIIGSTSQRILRGAGAPVLVVEAPTTEVQDVRAAPRWRS